MGFLLRFFSFLSIFDLYGTRLELYIDRKRTVQSRFGGFASLLVVGLAFYVLGSNIQAWVNLQDFKVISSAQSMSPADLLASDVNTTFYFTPENYYVYFSISADMGNGVFLEYYNLSRYIIPRMSLVDENLITWELTLENCWRKKQFEFLEEPYTGGDDDRGTAILCLKDEVLMGLFPSEQLQYINDPQLIYEIVKCQNSTDNNNSCATEEEIQNIMPLIQAQVSLPRTNYDFSDTQNPIKRTWDIDIYHLDYNLMKSFTAWLMPSYLKSDYGVWSQDYELNSIDFNLDHLVYETGIRNTEENDVFMAHYIWFGPNKQTYYRQNTKLTDIIGNFGGNVNILLTIGKLICGFYNFIVMKHKLINMAFEKLEFSEDNQTKPTKKT